MDDCVNISSSSDESEKTDRSSSATQQTSNGTTEKDTDNRPSTSKQRRPSRSRSKINLVDENSKFLADFDPGTSQREKRKLARSIRQSLCEPRESQTPQPTKTVTRNVGKDLCDCLNTACPGCHFPCDTCTSQKCGPVCRRNRKWFYQEIRIDGREEVYRNPYLTETSKK